MRKQLTDLDLLFQFTATMHDTHNLLVAVVSVGELARTRRRTVRLVVNPIVYYVSNHLKISIKDILGGSRQHQIVVARHVAMWLMHDAGLSFQKIANALDLDNHTTVLYACRKVEKDAELMAVALEIRAEVERAREELAATALSPETSEAA